MGKKCRMPLPSLEKTAVAVRQRTEVVAAEIDFVHITPTKVRMRRCEELIETLSCRATHRVDRNVALKEKDVPYCQQRARSIFILAQKWHL